MCPLCNCTFTMAELPGHASLCLLRADASRRRTAHPLRTGSGAAGAGPSGLAAAGQLERRQQQQPSARSGGGAVAREGAAPWSLPPKLNWHIMTHKDAKERVAGQGLPTKNKATNKDLTKDVSTWCQHTATSNHHFCALCYVLTLGVP